MFFVVTHVQLIQYLFGQFLKKARVTISCLSIDCDGLIYLSSLLIPVMLEWPYKYNDSVPLSEIRQT